MSRVDLSSQTTPQLVEQFRGLALAQCEANLGGQIAKYTRLYWKLDAITKDLRSREGDQRRTLVELYNHPSPQLRLEAAMATLVVFPNQVRAALQMIIDRQEFPQAGEAGFTLGDLAEGRFKPE
jgi:Domain of unknown function (DUF2019)